MREGADGCREFQIILPAREKGLGGLELGPGWKFRRPSVNLVCRTWFTNPAPTLLRYD